MKCRRAPLVGAPAMMGHPQRGRPVGAETLRATSVQCFGNKIVARACVGLWPVCDGPIGMGLPWWLSFCVSRLEGP